jgi:hypothetical protein
MPRTTAKARRLALAARIARQLFTNGQGRLASRLVLVDESTGTAKTAPARDLGGWSERDGFYLAPELVE